MRDHELHAGRNLDARTAKAAAFARLVERAVPRTIHGGDFTLEPTRFGHGLVYVLARHDGERFVVRFDADRERLARRVAIARALAACGVGTPRVVVARTGRLDRLRLRHALSVDEFCAGQPVTALADVERSAPLVGALFAALHDAPRSALPMVAGPATADALVALLRRRLRREARHDEPGVAALAARDAKHTLFPPQTPRACLWDVGPKNVLVGATAATAIDVEDVRFDSAAYELARVRHHLFDQKPAAFDAFMRAYANAASPALRAEIDAALPPCELLFLARHARTSKWPGQRLRFARRLAECSDSERGDY